MFEQLAMLDFCDRPPRLQRVRTWSTASVRTLFKSVVEVVTYNGHRPCARRYTRRRRTVQPCARVSIRWIADD